MVHQAVQDSRRQLLVIKNSIPFIERQICGNYHTPRIIMLRYQAQVFLLLDIMHAGAVDWYDLLPL